MIEWFARNTVAANLLMVVILVAGVVGAFDVRQEMIPEFELDRINIQVAYLGAAPAEVESAVCIRIEEAIQGIDGIKTITSTASEGMGTVLVELALGADRRKVVDDVKSSVDAIDTFPAETERPIIRELTARTQVVEVAVSGSVDELTLKTYAERVRSDLSALPEISQVELVSARPYEISIEVSELALRRHGLTFDDVAAAVRRSSFDMPGGSIRTDGGELLLRTLGQAYRGAEFEALVLLTRADGTRLLLRDVATVIDGFAETDQAPSTGPHPRGRGHSEHQRPGLDRLSAVSVERRGRRHAGREWPDHPVGYHRRRRSVCPDGAATRTLHPRGEQGRVSDPSLRADPRLQKGHAAPTRTKGDTEAVDMHLPRGGVLTGRVVDPFGHPAVGARVEAERYQFATGR
jgi:hypothetical protein